MSFHCRMRYRCLNVLQDLAYFQDVHVHKDIHKQYLDYQKYLQFITHSLSAFFPRQFPHTNSAWCIYFQSLFSVCISLRERATSCWCKQAPWINSRVDSLLCIFFSPCLIVCLTVPLIVKNPGYVYHHTSLCCYRSNLHVVVVNSDCK